MKYVLDSSGFIQAVSFGCYLENGLDYTGEVPIGYRNLDEWSLNACIQAYYIDSNGNLVLDSERLEECEKREAQESIDNAPLVRKDLFEHNEVLDSQYVRQTASGKVVVLEDIKTLAPKVKLTNVQPYEYDKITIHTQGKNMLPCIAKTETIEGVKFTKNMDGSLSVVGTALQDIEYVIVESDRTIFSLKANENYFLNLGGLNCEMRFVNNGEIAQQYVGASGLINVPEHIEVSQVVIKIAKGESANTTFYPQLEYGKFFTDYAEYKCKTFEVNISDIVTRYLVPSDDLYPSDTLLLKEVTKIDYIVIENNAINVSANGLEKRFTGGSFGLFSSYSTIYAVKDIDLEIEYSTNMIKVDSLEFLQGKATTSNQFKILNDGSIEAHNGYFSGRIEADSGYFKGEISWEQITGNDDVATRTYIDGLGYQDANQVTKITKDTVTTSYIKGLNLKVGNEIQMGEDATISWYNVNNKPNIPTDTGHLTNGAGYQNANQVTTITKNTVNTAYVNALNVTAGSVRAENIIGTTISGKHFVGGEVRSTNYAFSSDAYRCGGGMRMNLANGEIWWANGSIKASSGFINSLGYECIIPSGGYNIYFKNALCIKGGSASSTTLLLGGGFANVQLPSGATVTSLAKLKDNIMPCSNALSAIQNTDGYYFNYKDDTVKRSDSQKVGFVIGDGYKCDERLLSKDKDAIDIYNAIGLNWRATQQLYDKIKKQQKQIDELLSLVKGGAE